MKTEATKSKTILNNLTDLKPRKAPQQKRAEQTVSHLLEVAATLLDEVGLDNFNTNLLAERANLRVASVYRYYPNKLAILSALLENWLYQIMDETAELVTALKNPEEDWRDIIERFIDTYLAIVVKSKGHLAIRRSVLAAPELIQIEARLIRRLSVGIIEALLARGVKQPLVNLHDTVELFLTTTAQGIDLAYIKSRKNRNALATITAEVKLQQKCYLANILD